MSKVKPSQDFNIEQSIAEPQLKPAQEWSESDWQSMAPISAGTIAPPRGKLSRWLLVLVLILLGVEAGLLLWQSWQQHLALFALYALTFGLALFWLSRLLWQELRRLRQLKQSAQLRETGRRLSQSQQQGEAQALMEKLHNSLPAQFERQWQQYCQQSQAHHSDAELLKLYEMTVVRAQDQQVTDCVYRYSAQASLLLAASPMAALDMALMLWRNQKMLDEIAQIYGIEPGYWSRVRLIRSMMYNLLYAGGSELALDLGSQLLAVEITGKLSARVAQGLGAGLLSARLGYAAMAECRPLPFIAQPRPALLTVQTHLLKELTQLSAEALQRAKASSTTSQS